MFKGRHFDQSVILLCVRWYLAYGLSLRDLKEMMGEWQNLPRLWLQTLDRDSWPRHGQAPGAARSLSMLQR